MMSQTALSTELQAMVPVLVELTGIQNWADAYGTFALDAIANLVPITSVAVGTAKLAMVPAMVGINVPGQGVPKILAGLAAFWASIASTPAVSFVGASAITPPPFAGLAVALTATFAANLAAKLDLPDAADAIATVVHAETIIGGTATFTGPVVAPIL